MTTTTSPARARADKYAAMAPTGAEVTVTEETYDLLGQARHIAQVTIRGSIDLIIVTIGSADTGRPRTSASMMFKSGDHERKLKVSDIAYFIRRIYV